MAHKILVVDDDKISVALVKFGLAQERYEVIIANDGEEALGKVQTEKPDLIVLDICMPKMNGYEFMTELKRLEGVKTTPVIMLTGNETMSDIFRLEGVKGYFVKPVDLPKLITKIKNCLGENPI